MISTLAKVLQPILEQPLIRRIRRNHGLEHATIHMLSRRVRNLKIAGRADHSGFFLYGEVDTEAVSEAAAEALSRLQAGEARWAIHPNCGTMLVTTGLLTSGAAVIGLGGASSRSESLNRFPYVLLLSILALLLSQPAGYAAQKHITTAGTPGDLAILRVTRYENRLFFGKPITIHRVQTQKG